MLYMAVVDMLGGEKEFEVPYIDVPAVIETKFTGRDTTRSIADGKKAIRLKGRGLPISSGEWRLVPCI